jgi:hypothetical protein
MRLEGTGRTRVLLLPLWHRLRWGVKGGEREGELERVRG